MFEPAAERVDVTDPVLLVRINQLYRPNMSSQALYEATRGIWKVGGSRRTRVKYALAVFEGIVREVFTVDAWQRAGNSRYETRDFDNRDLDWSLGVHRSCRTGRSAVALRRSLGRALLPSGKREPGDVPKRG